MTPMNDLKVSLAFGTMLVILGVALFRWHFSEWKAHRRNAALSDPQRNFFRQQFRRRIQVAVLIIVLGGFVPLLDFMISMKWARPFTALACISLLVTTWIMFLAALDWFSLRVSRRVRSASWSSVAQKREAIEAEIRRLRNPSDNDQPPHSDPPSE
jgi:hypothetical protein